jgi:hypothetical protein
MPGIDRRFVVVAEIGTQGFDPVALALSLRSGRARFFACCFELLELFLDLLRRLKNAILPKLLLVFVYIPSCFLYYPTANSLDNRPLGPKCKTLRLRNNAWIALHCVNQADRFGIQGILGLIR